MAVWSKVNLSELRYTRFDGEFYSPKYIHEDKIWASFTQKYSIEKLFRLISKPVRTGRTPKKRNISSEDVSVHFVKTNTLREGRIEYSLCDYLPKRVLRNKDFINENNVVVTIIGATPEIVGRVAIVRDIDPQCVTNQNVAVIDVNEKINPFYLTAYLMSKFGRNQIWRQSRRTEQVNLNCREVERVIVPMVPRTYQDAVGELVSRSFSLLDESKLLFSEAQGLLNNELSLERLVMDKSKSYESRFSEVVGNGRIDPDHYQTKYKQIKEVIQNYPAGFQPLLQLADALTPNISPDKAPLEKFQYIELSNIDSTLGLVGTCKIVKGCEAPSRAKRLVSVGDIVASAVVGSIEKVGLIDSSKDGALASTGFFHFRARNVEPEYLLVLIKSLLVKMQLQQEATGGILSAVSDAKLKNIIVPSVPINIQNKITQLVKASFSAKSESAQLLEQAKKQVEGLIEGVI